MPSLAGTWVLAGLPSPPPPPPTLYYSYYIAVTEENYKENSRMQPSTVQYNKDFRLPPQVLLSRALDYNTN